MTRPARRLTPLLAIVAAVVGVVAVAGGWASSHEIDAGGALQPVVGAPAAATTSGPARAVTTDDGRVARSAGVAPPATPDGPALRRSTDVAHELGRSAGRDTPAMRRLGADPRHVTAHAAPLVVVPGVVLLGLLAVRGRVALARAASLWRALVDHALRRGPPSLVVA